MNRVYISIYFNLSLLLLLALCGFQYISPICESLHYIRLFPYPNYCGFLEIVNGVVFLNLVSMCSLLVYRTIIEMFIFILYPVTLLVLGLIPLLSPGLATSVLGKLNDLLIQ